MPSDNEHADIVFSQSSSGSENENILALDFTPFGRLSLLIVKLGVVSKLRGGTFKGAMEKSKSSIASSDRQEEVNAVSDFNDAYNLATNLKTEREEMRKTRANTLLTFYGQDARGMLKEQVTLYGTLAIEASILSLIKQFKQSNPSARSESDTQQGIQILEEGLTAIASDQEPQTVKEKRLALWDDAHLYLGNGLIETASEIKVIYGETINETITICGIMDQQASLRTEQRLANKEKLSPLLDALNEGLQHPVKELLCRVIARDKGYETDISEAINLELEVFFTTKNFSINKKISKKIKNTANVLADALESQESGENMPARILDAINDLNIIFEEKTNKPHGIKRSFTEMTKKQDDDNIVTKSK
jgi:hypothetical protein